MWRSLKTRSASACLHVLCLNEACQEILESLKLPDVHLHPLSALEAADPALLGARSNRSRVEYYFTLTPCLPLYLLRTHPEISQLTYVDADLFFFADPQPVLDEIHGHAVGIIEHRFPDELVYLEKHGRFNVGWLTFNRDPVALDCLKVWREQCINWCYDRVEPGRFAEQKYLDEWPTRFDGIWVVQHRGANVAPWNLNRFELSLQGEELRVGGQPILFFHAHGFRPSGAGRAATLNLKQYGVAATPLMLLNIFEPYERALVDATAEIAVPLAQALLSDESRNTAVVLEDLRAQVAAIGHQLEVCELDRAARLDVIHGLQAELEASEADRAARLDVIHVLQKELKASEADRAARLDVIHVLQRELKASEVDRAVRLDVIHGLQGELATSEAESTSRLEMVHRLQTELMASEAGREVHTALIHTLQKDLLASEADRASLVDVLQTLQTKLGASEADRSVQLDSIRAMQEKLEASEDDRATRICLIDELQKRVAALNTELKDVRTQLAQARSRVEALELSRTWRWTRPLRRMASWLERPPKGA
jgi:hypothetical protein